MASVISLVLLLLAGLPLAAGVVTSLTQLGRWPPPGPPAEHAASDGIVCGLLLGAVVWLALTV